MNTVIETVLDQARRTPSSAAVSFAGDALSYQELVERSAAVAAVLRGRGVAPGDTVGLLLERSLDLIPCILGTWLAGAVYVPLDAGYPPRRLGYMVDAARVRLVVCDQMLTELAKRFGAPALPVEPAWWSDGGQAPPVPAAEPDQDAYLMFTSGSTGRPKGVRVPHGAVVAVFEALAGELDLHSDEVWLAITPTSFDISVLELLLTLTVGGEVVVAPRETTRQAGALIDLATSCRATVLQATPVTWRMLFDDDRAAELDLRILCGGEALTADLAARFAGHGRGQWNLYGPTEATIWAAAWRIHQATGAGVRIGLPLRSARFLVVDEALTPLPQGTAGELLIAGPCLANGYLNDPTTTAARFVAGPLGERHYRTGDLVRQRPGGDYEFLGRIDSQVKVRGHRIEVTEIEAVLRQHPQVSDALVTAPLDAATGERRLVAYVVPGTRRPTSAGLRRYLCEELPPHMVPAEFLALDRVPLTPNGKVDRAAVQSTERMRAPGPKVGK